MVVTLDDSTQDTHEYADGSARIEAALANVDLASRSRNAKRWWQAKRALWQVRREIAVEEAAAIKIQAMTRGRLAREDVPVARNAFRLEGPQYQQMLAAPPTTPSESSSQATSRPGTGSHVRPVSSTSTLSRRSQLPAVELAVRIDERLTTPPRTPSSSTMSSPGAPKQTPPGSRPGGRDTFLEATKHEKNEGSPSGSSKQQEASAATPSTLPPSSSTQRSVRRVPDLSALQRKLLNTTQTPSEQTASIARLVSPLPRSSKRESKGGASDGVESGKLSWPPTYSGYRPVVAHSPRRSSSPAPTRAFPSFQPNLPRSISVDFHVPLKAPREEWSRRLYGHMQDFSNMREVSFMKKPHSNSDPCFP